MNTSAASGIPGTPIKYGKPGVVGIPVCLGAFLPIGRYRNFDHGIFPLDIIYQLGIQVIGAGGTGIESKHFIHDLPLVIHCKKPDCQFPGFEFFPELFTLDASKGDPISSPYFS